MASYNGTLYNVPIVQTNVDNNATLYDITLLKSFVGSVKIFQEWNTEYPTPPTPKTIGQLWPRGNW